MISKKAGMGTERHNWHLDLAHEQWVALPVSGPRPLARYKVFFIVEISLDLFLQDPLLLLAPVFSAFLSFGLKQFVFTCDLDLILSIYLLFYQIYKHMDS